MLPSQKIITVKRKIKVFSQKDTHGICTSVPFTKNFKVFNSQSFSFTAVPNAMTSEAPGAIAEV